MALPTHYSGEFLPIIKYDARAGKFFKVIRTLAPDGHYESTSVELPPPVGFVMDFASLEIGWMCFATGIPDLILTPWALEDQLAGVEPKFDEQPTVDHRMGFRLLVKTAEGEIRHFSHSSATVYRAFSALHDHFLSHKAEAADPSKCPVVKVASILPVKSRQGATNYEPQFAIVKWVDRPFEFDEHQPVPSAAAYAGANTSVHPDSTGDDDMPF